MADDAPLNPQLEQLMGVIQKAAEQRNVDRLRNAMKKLVVKADAELDDGVRNAIGLELVEMAVAFEDAEMLLVGKVVGLLMFETESDGDERIEQFRAEAAEELSQLEGQFEGWTLVKPFDFLVYQKKTRRSRVSRAPAVVASPAAVASPTVATPLSQAAPALPAVPKTRVASQAPSRSGSVAGVSSVASGSRHRKASAAPSSVVTVAASSAPAVETLDDAGDAASESDVEEVPAVTGGKPAKASKKPVISKEDAASAERGGVTASPACGPCAAGKGGVPWVCRVRPGKKGCSMCTARKVGCPFNDSEGKEVKKEKVVGGREKQVVLGEPVYEDDGEGGSARGTKRRRGGDLAPIQTSVANAGATRTFAGREVLQSVVMPGFVNPDAPIFETRTRTSNELLQRPVIGALPMGIDREAAGLDSPTYASLPRDLKVALWDVADGNDHVQHGSRMISNAIPGLVAAKTMREAEKLGMVGAGSGSGKGKGKA
ncbi:hypothetical protein SCHPADRAFT_947373 [Schizopora paradoxa]|uniref:Uncharacterized protein n=1 Tax=Schizopora paradoxa TaxID=27342 RepID=A0A0H2RJ75_9AGAM|nr:hypothetical protein SCHPADRAFT_947373 [Schizopora paradoxa]